MTKKEIVEKAEYIMGVYSYPMVQSWINRFGYDLVEGQLSRPEIVPWVRKASNKHGYMEMLFRAEQSRSIEKLSGESKRAERESSEIAWNNFKRHA